MSAFSDYAESALLNHLLRNTALTSPVTVYLALFTTDPLDDGSGTEASGGSYAREAITFGAPTTVSGGKQVANSVQIDFTTATAAWGNITHGGIYDALTVGNLLVHGAAAAVRDVQIGDGYRIAVGDLKVRLS